MNAEEQLVLDWVRRMDGGWVMREVADNGIYDGEGRGKCCILNVNSTREGVLLQGHSWAEILRKLNTIALNRPK